MPIAIFQRKEGEQLIPILGPVITYENRVGEKSVQEVDLEVGSENDNAEMALQNGKSGLFGIKFGGPRGTVNSIYAPGAMSATHDYGVKVDSKLPIHVNFQIKP